MSTQITYSPTRHTRERIRCLSCETILCSFNPGPYCYVCQRDHVEVRKRTPRRNLPLDDIVAAFRRVRNTSGVARELGLPRSSVWSVIQRAKRDGRLDDDWPEAGDEAA